MALLYWQNTFSNHLKYAATVPAGGNWILVPKFLPVAAAIVPVQGSIIAGDFITILGSGFDDGVTVTLGGIAVTNLVVVDSTVLTMTAGAHAAGAVNVLVTNSDTNTSTLVNGYTYAAAQWWEYNPAAGFGIPSGNGSWWSFGGPPVPFRFIKSESPLQTAITAPPLAVTAPILKKSLLLAPTVDPISWTPGGATAPIDTRGWYFSSNGYTADTMLALAPGSPKHPRAWDKVSAFSTLLGGLPSVNYRNGIVYAGDDYIVGSTAPTVREFNAGADRLILTIPNTASGVIPTAIMSMLLVGDTLYISTLDSGSAPATYLGRVFSYDLVLQILTPLGAVFPIGELPYAMAWHMGRLWVGTNSGNGANGNVYFFRPDVDTAFTQDTTSLATPFAPTVSGYITSSGGSTDYKYAITAVNAQGQSIGSPVLDVAVGPATITTAAYTILSWSAVTGATGYNIFRTSSSGTPSTTGIIGATADAIINGVLVPAALTFNDTGTAGDGSTLPIANTSQLQQPTAPTSDANPGQSTSYSYVVVAINAIGHSQGSPTYVKTDGYAVLTGTQGVQLRWAAIPGPATLTYNVYRIASSGTPSSTGLIGTSLGGQFPSFFDSGLAGDSTSPPITNTSGLATPAIPVLVGFFSVAGSGSTDRKYAVVAINALGHSIGSTTIDSPTGPAALSSTNYIILQLPALEFGAVSYDIYRTVAGGTPNTTGKIGNSAGLGTFNDTGLAGDSSSLPVVNTTSVGGVCSMLSYQGYLVIGTSRVAGTFATLLVRNPAGAYITIATGTGGTARANNGWLAMKIFQNTLYVSYWNPDGTAISTIWSVQGVVTLVYTGATGTLRPFIAFAVNNGTQQMFALGGGSGLRAALVTTLNGTVWTDLSTILNTIVTETLTPAFGFIGV
jgi:hypothetical protein